MKGEISSLRLVDAIVRICCFWMTLFGICLTLKKFWPITYGWVDIQTESKIVNFGEEEVKFNLKSGGFKETDDPLFGRPPRDIFPKREREREERYGRGF